LGGTEKRPEGVAEMDTKNGKENQSSNDNTPVINHISQQPGGSHANRSTHTPGCSIFIPQTISQLKTQLDDYNRLYWIIFGGAK
jgi:hypothetical protein